MGTTISALLSFLSLYLWLFIDPLKSTGCGKAIRIMNNLDHIQKLLKHWEKSLLNYTVLCINIEHTPSPIFSNYWLLVVLVGFLNCFWLLYFISIWVRELGSIFTATLVVLVVTESRASIHYLFIHPIMYSTIFSGAQGCLKERIEGQLWKTQLKTNKLLRLVICK